MTNKEFHFGLGESKVPTGHPSGDARLWFNYLSYVSLEEVGVDLGVIVSRMVFKAA